MREARRMRGNRRVDSGASAVEFALVMPMVILLVLGALDFGLLLQARAQAANAAREGVRFAALGYKAAEVEKIAQNSVTGVSGTVQAKAECISVNAVPCTLGGESSGNTAKVTVSIRYQGVTGLFPLLTETSFETSSVMRIE